MAKIMEIHLPDEIAHYEGDLRYFFDTMVRKLYWNRHKGFADGCSIGGLTNGATNEINEFVQAIGDGEPQPAAYAEAADAANMMFLAALLVSRMTRDEYDTYRRQP